MATISKQKLILVKSLYYKEHYSVKRIAEKLAVSSDAVMYFMRQNDLKRRTLKEDSALRFKDKPLSYQLI